MIFKFADGNTLEDIQYKTFHREVCPTCGFGDEIIHEFDLITSHYRVTATTEQDYVASYLIKLLANPVLKIYTEEMFIKFISIELKRLYGILAKISNSEV